MSSKNAFKIFVSGTAGTGKSFLIKTIADQLTIDYTDETNRATKPAVLLAAPTGIAAIQINGCTIHNLFNIEVQQGRDSAFKELKSAHLNVKQYLFQNVKLIIIDEISMVSNITLAKMHRRLTEIKENNEIFGNVNMLVFGDLLQLPSVNAPYVFDVCYLKNNFLYTI